MFRQSFPVEDVSEVKPQIIWGDVSSCGGGAYWTAKKKPQNSDLNPNQAIAVLQLPQTQWHESTAILFCSWIW